MRAKRIKCTETGDVFPSASAAARWTGIAQGQLSTACSKGGCTAGLHWTFTDEPVSVNLDGDAEGTAALRARLAAAGCPRTTYVDAQTPRADAHKVFLVRRTDGAAVCTGAARDLTRALHTLMAEVPAVTAAGCAVTVHTQVDDPAQAKRLAAELAEREGTEVWRSARPGGRPKVDEVGHVYGRLTVTAAAEPINGAAAWVCRCACGNTVTVRGVDLRKGVQSCGCLRRRHGAAGTPLHGVWRAMHQRCTNPRHPAYADYGGRGIEVCARWTGVDGFANFRADMGEPLEGMSLDRVDVNGDYEPGNCRWATAVQQANNRRTNTRVEVGGEVLTLSEVAARSGVACSTVRDRFARGVAPEHLGDPPTTRPAIGAGPTLADFADPQRLIAVRRGRGTPVTTEDVPLARLVADHAAAHAEWSAMIKRCAGALDDRWASFRSFLADVGDPPADHVLRRVDVEGDFGPDNWWWTTRAEAALNTAATAWVHAQGVTAPRAVAEQAVGARRLRGQLARGEAHAVDRPAAFGGAPHRPALTPAELAAHKVWVGLVAAENVDPRWSVFANFLADVGLPEGPDAELVRPNASAPLGPGNGEWRSVYVGMRVGTLTVEAPVKTRWRARCDCGRVVELSAHALLTRTKVGCGRSCGLGQDRRSALVGRTFGGLEVTGLADEEDALVCRCTACGKSVVVKRRRLLYNPSSSCGCLRGQAVAAANRRRADPRRGTPTYTRWTALRRTHTVVPAWRADFDQFLADVGECPEGCTFLVPRQGEPAGPSNFAWIPVDEKPLHRTNAVKLTIGGVTKLASAWAADFGVSPQRVATLLARGVDPEDAVHGREVYSDGRRPPRTRVGTLADFVDQVVGMDQLTAHTAELIGETFGELTVISGLRPYRGESQVLCRCSCGRFVATDGTQLRSGALRSCGCLRGRPPGR